MNTELLPYFNEEMAYLQEAGAEFAKAYPKVAGRLKLNAQGTTDPQTGLLLESFALLNARIQAKLHDDFPQLTQTLLNMLYPHYQAPIPALSITQFQPAPDLAENIVIPAGTLLETNPALGEICRFQTCYDTELLPVTVTAAELSRHLSYMPENVGRLAESCLRLVLRCSDDDMTFAQLKPDKLRFYLQGQSQQAFALYELLCKNAVSIGLKGASQDTLRWLKPSAIGKVGFDNQESLLPYSARSMPGYRLLTEFFIFPEKFLFFDLRVDEHIASMTDNQLELYIYFNRSHDTLAKYVRADMFALSCTPVVNLFQHHAEPVLLHQQQYQYPIIADSRHPDALTVYSVDKVTGIDSSGNDSAYLPFYAMQQGANGAFWLATRDANYAAKDVQLNEQVSLSLVNLTANNEQRADEVLYVETTCLNRTLPADLAYTHEPFALQFSTFSAPVVAIRMLLSPTIARPPLVRSQSRYALLAHLASNHISLMNAQESLTALRNIMKLYNFSGDDTCLAMSNCIMDMKTQRVMRHCKFGGMSTLCQGIAIHLVLDDTGFVGNSAYLFAEVIERFLALYCSMNSFIELLVVSKDNAREIYRGQPQSGDKLLL